MTPTRVAGHTLPDEGRILNAYGYRTNTEPATCTCGAQSEDLHSDGARKRWHRQHKAEVIGKESRR